MCQDLLKVLYKYKVTTYNSLMLVIISILQVRKWVLSSWTACPQSPASEQRSLRSHPGSGSSGPEVLSECCAIPMTDSWLHFYIQFILEKMIGILVKYSDIDCNTV